jgi:hypothetical protein
MKLIERIKENMIWAMKGIVDLNKEAHDKSEYMSLFAQRDVDRAIISMCPAINVKPDVATDEQIQTLLRKYINEEKVKVLYKEHHIISKDAKGLSSKQLKEFEKQKIEELGDVLDTLEVRYARSYLPKQAMESDIKDVLNEIEWDKFPNKLAAMKIVIGKLSNPDPQLVKKLILSYEI